MKDLIHTISFVSLLIWLVGYFKCELDGGVHVFLVIALITAIVRFFMEKELFKSGAVAANLKKRKGADR
jgi:hypothetical protein